MGKSQKKRSMRRHNPVRVPDSHLPKGLASASASSSKSEAILPILQKMENPDAAERKWACVAVSNLIQNDPSTRRLLQGKNVVGALITRLTDSEEEVVIEAAGALRNLCIDGGYDICAEMYNKNILASLHTFVPKISTTLAQYLEAPKTAPENAQNLVYEFADNVITILWCLSETSNKALNAINQIKLVPFLMSFLASRDHLPLATATSAGQCLYVLTDDNYPAIDDVRSNAAYISCLLSIVQSDHAANEKAKSTSETLSVLASGILRNVSPISSPVAASAVDIDKDIVLPLLQPVISSVSLLEITNKALEHVSRETAEPLMENLSLKHTPKSDHKTPAEIELERLELKLRTVQLALEILTGLSATLPEPDPEADAGTREGEDEEDDDDDDNADDNDVKMAVDDATSMTAPTPSTPALLPALVQPLLTLIQPTPLSFPPLGGLSPHPPTTSVLSAVHVCALECLNNIFLPLAISPNPTIAADRESGRHVWDRVWTALGVVGTQSGPGQEKRKEFWEIAVGVLWGIGNVWKGSLEGSDEQVRVLIQFCETSSDPRIKVKCIGTLESLAQYPTSIDINRTISSYLLSILPTPTEPSPAGTEPLIQAISALIDIYSDENMAYDVNFRQGGFIERLSASVDGVKKAVKGIDKRKEGGKELRRRGEEMRDNLVGFIDYRKHLGF